MLVIARAKIMIAYHYWRMLRKMLNIQLRGKLWLSREF